MKKTFGQTLLTPITPGTQPGIPVMPSGGIQLTAPSSSAMPGPMTSPLVLPSPIQDEIETLKNTEQYQKGITAFQQLSTAHPLFRSTFMLPQFVDDDAETSFFHDYSEDLQTLRDDLINVPDDVVMSMYDWVEGVTGNISYSPDEIVLLVEKLILKEKVSFPPVELPARIIPFLSKVLRTTVTGTKEAALRNQQDSLRQVLYAKINALSAAQGKFETAVSLAYFPANTKDPVAYAENLLNQAGNQQAQAVIDAQAVVNSAQADFQSAQNAIQALDEQMAALQGTILTPDQLAVYLMNNLASGPTLDAFTKAYDTLEQNVALYHSLIDPLQKGINDTMAAMVPFQNNLATAEAAFFSARTVINYASEGGPQPTPDQMNTYQITQSVYNQSVAVLQPYLDKVSNLESQMAAVMKAHPEFYYESKIIVDPATASTIITESLTEAAASSPADLITLIQAAMQVEASAADQRTKDLENEQSELIQEKQDAFNAFYMDQAEAKIQFYQTQMATAQDGYNALNNTLTALSGKCQTLQDEINANINALGQVIGWWCHENNISDAVMDQPYFIGLALNAVSSLRGKYDIVYIPLGIGGLSSNQVFWDVNFGLGQSYDVANQTIMLMQERETAELDYNEQSPGLQNQMKTISDWMTQVQSAFQITQDLINSPSFAQSLVPLFAATPQGQLLDSDVLAIVNPLRQINQQVQADQQTMQGILDDIEKQILSDQGMNVSDITILSYEDKKKLWVGVCDHLTGPGQRIDELNGYISDISARIQAGTPQDYDAENLQLAKVALMNIIGAQNIQRALQNDLVFMAAMNDEAHEDYQTALNTAQSTAQAAGATGASTTGGQS